MSFIYTALEHHRCDMCIRSVQSQTDGCRLSATASFCFFFLLFGFLLWLLLLPCSGCPVVALCGRSGFLFCAFPTGALVRQSVPRPGRLVLFDAMFEVRPQRLCLQLGLPAVRLSLCQSSVFDGLAVPALACGSWFAVWWLARHLASVNSDGRHESSGPLRGGRACSSLVHAHPSHVRPGQVPCRLVLRPNTY